MKYMEMNIRMLLMLWRISCIAIKITESQVPSGATMLVQLIKPTWTLSPFQPSVRYIHPSMAIG